MFGANFMEIYQVIVSPDSLLTDIQSSIVEHTSNIGAHRHTERHFVKTNLLNSGDPRPNISTEMSNSTGRGRPQAELARGRHAKRAEVSASCGN